MSIKAVITGDLIDSSHLTSEEKTQAIHVLKKEFNNLVNGGDKFSLFRGDSFQGLINNATDALRIALIIKTALNQQSTSDTEKYKQSRFNMDARIAIGLGSIEIIRSKIEESDGEAFRNSGRSLDKMKDNNQSLIIKTPWPVVNGEFETTLKLFDALMERWSIASAEVLYYLLKGLKEQEIATQLKISQPAVNSRKKAVHWDAIEHLLNRYKTVVQQKIEANE